MARSVANVAKPVVSFAAMAAKKKTSARKGKVFDRHLQDVITVTDETSIEILVTKIMALLPIGRKAALLLAKKDICAQDCSRADCRWFCDRNWGHTGHCRHDKEPRHHWPKRRPTS